MAPSPPGNCSRCAEGCEVCEFSPDQCFICFEGYDFLSATNSCVKCSQTYPHCQACNTTGCAVCHEGYFLDDSSYTDTGVCLPCSFYMHAC